MGDRFVFQIVKDGGEIIREIAHENWSFPEDEEIKKIVDEYPECTIRIVREYFALPFA